MLKCDHCEYDLTSLVRGPEVVTCPECGRETPHENGRSIKRVDAFTTLSRIKWIILALPSLCIVALGLAPFINTRTGGALGSQMKVTETLFYLTLILLAGTAVWPVASALRLGYKWPQCLMAGVTLFGLSIGLVMVTLFTGLVVAWLITR